MGHLRLFIMNPSNFSGFCSNVWPSRRPSRISHPRKRFGSGRTLTCVLPLAVDRGRCGGGGWSERAASFESSEFSLPSLSFVSLSLSSCKNKKKQSKTESSALHRAITRNNSKTTWKYTQVLPAHSVHQCASSFYSCWESQQNVLFRVIKHASPSQIHEIFNNYTYVTQQQLPVDNTNNRVSNSQKIYFYTIQITSAVCHKL